MLAYLTKPVFCNIVGDCDNRFFSGEGGGRGKCNRHNRNRVILKFFNGHILRVIICLAYSFRFDLLHDWPSF